MLPRRLLTIIGLSSISVFSPLATAMAAARENVAAQPAKAATSKAIVPDVLYGVWKLDRNASTFETVPPRKQFRIFSYQHDGAILAVNITVGVEGTPTVGNFVIRADGVKAAEYTSASKSAPYAIISLTPSASQSLAIVAERDGGHIMTATLQVSADGNTLQIRSIAGGKKNIAIYRRWTLPA